MLTSIVWPGYLILEILAVVLALEAIFKSRTPQGAVSWALGLIFLPPLVVPAYLLLGARRFYGYVEARRLGNVQLQKSAQAVVTGMQEVDSSEAELPVRLRLLETLASLPFTRGNAVDIFIHGEQSYREMFAAIDRAEHYILLQFYIVRDDKVGWALAERLIRRAEEGIPIYFLYDQIGSLALSNRYLKTLQKAGVQVRGFRGLRWNFKGRFQINFRNHRKILLIDGQEAFVGGLNIGDEHCNRHPVLTPWRDTLIHLRGPAVAGVQLTFIEDWFWVATEELSLHWTPDKHVEDCRVLALPTGPADHHDTCQLMFIDAINSAVRRVWIVSPYFVPDEPIIKALKLASFRGVEVKILTPGITDNRIVQLVSYDFIGELRDTQVQFYQYQNGFLHQKVMLVDDDTVYVGTANLDNRSFRLNFELTLVVADQRINQQVEKMLEVDFQDSLRLDNNFIHQQGLLFRLLVKIARLFSPLQ